jgi:hypothetical protein
VGGRSVEVDTLIERVDLNSGVGSGGECALSTLTHSAETAKSADETVVEIFSPRWVSPAEDLTSKILS